MISLNRPYYFRFFKVCHPQLSLGPFLNTPYHIRPQPPSKEIPSLCFSKEGNLAEDFSCHPSMSQNTLWTPIRPSQHFSRHCKWISKYNRNQEDKTGVWSYTCFIQIEGGVKARTHIAKEKKCMEFSRNVDLSE